MDDDIQGAASSASGSSGSSGGGLTADVAAQLPVLLKAAALARGPTVKSVLLKNDVLTVSISSDYRAHQGRLAVFFENISRYDIQNLRVTVTPLPTSANAINVKQQDPSVRVAPAEETRMQLAVECARPFPDAYPLQMTVHFTISGNNYAYELPLPVSITSFFEAMPTADKATYMNRWKSMDGGDHEAQVVFSSARPVDPQLLQHIRGVIVPAIKLGLAEGLDNDRTVTGSSSFVTGTFCVCICVL